MRLLHLIFRARRHLSRLLLQELHPFLLVHDCLLIEFKVGFVTTSCTIHRKVGRVVESAILIGIHQGVVLHQVGSLSLILLVLDGGGSDDLPLFLVILL